MLRADHIAGLRWRVTRADGHAGSAAPTCANGPNRRSNRGAAGHQFNNIDAVLPRGHKIIAKKIAWADAHARPILLAFSDELKLPQRGPTKIKREQCPEFEWDMFPLSNPRIFGNWRGGVRWG